MLFDGFLSILLGIILERQLSSLAKNDTEPDSRNEIESADFETKPVEGWNGLEDMTVYPC